MSTKYQSSIAQKGFSGRRGERGAPFEKPKNRKDTLARLLKYFAMEKKSVLILLVIVLIGVLAGIAAPAFQSSAIDRIISGDYAALPRILVIMTVLYAVYGASTLAQGFLSASLSQKVVRRMRSDLFEKIVSLPLSYVDSHSHGDIMSRMTNDADNISTVISSSLSSIFSGILTLIGTIAVMMWYSVPLTLLTCSTVIFTILLTRLLTKKVRRFFLQRQVLLGKLNGTAEEMITNAKTVAAYSREDAVISDFAKTSDDLTRTGIIAEIISGSMGPIMNCLSNVSFVIVAVFGAWFALQGWITVGVISAFTIYSKQFSRPINELAQLYGQVETALAGAERMFNILDVESEDMAGENLPETVKGNIVFDHVNFSYVPGKQVIRDFSLFIGSGRKIALVGATGSGKTTIINLLMRFYDIDSGDIYLDGKNLKDISRGSLRSHIGIVLQDTVLFADTVRNNLTYADPDATQSEIDEAVRLSNADKLIRHLPDGYETVLSESGSSLSQGQRQLLAIGRAFLSSPDILILDEATSSVDTRTEQNIQDAMVNLMSNRTSLIIAHRLSTIQDADEIIVMEHGEIVEKGNHDQLIAGKGKYYELYMTQFAGQAT